MDQDGVPGQLKVSTIVVRIHGFGWDLFVLSFSRTHCDLS